MEAAPARQRVTRRRSHRYRSPGGVSGLLVKRSWADDIHEVIVKVSEEGLPPPGTQFLTSAAQPEGRYAATRVTDGVDALVQQFDCGCPAGRTTDRGNP